MYQVKIEKIIAKDPSTVFQSLKEGRLFMNCTADSKSMEIDFRVGGKYLLNFKNHRASNWGEFLEIVPDKKIIFTWCQTFGPDQKPDTKVTIELFPEGKGTRLSLQHDGFQDQANCDNHYQGWNGGLTDMTQEMEKGMIRLLRRFDTPVKNLFEIIQTCGLFGSLQVLVPGQKFSAGPEATLTCNSKDDGTSSLEIIQGPLSQEDMKKHREHWDTITTKLMDLIS